MSSVLDSVGLNTTQVLLLASGAFLAFAYPAIEHKKGNERDVVTNAGWVALAAGIAWWAYNKFSGSSISLATYAHPGGFYDPVTPSGYANPRNNFSDVKPRNRYDLQTNYILNDKNSSFDNYVNDIVINESKKAGLNLLDKNNYPVKIEPYLLPALNPTTVTTPIRDFNTVKMIA